MLINATIQQGNSGFYINSRFHGQVFFTAPENGSVCKLVHEGDKYSDIDIDLSTVTILDSGGADVTPATNTEKIALINQYTAWIHAN